MEDQTKANGQGDKREEASGQQPTDNGQQTGSRQPTDGGQQQPASAATAADDELAKAKKEAQDNLDGWKRANADYANLKKDMERMQAEYARYAASKLITELLPTLDAFKKADEQRPKDGETDAAKIKAWTDGVGHIRSRLESVLKTAGVTAIDQAGVPFDPSKHEAMMMEKGGKDSPPGTVIKVLEPGYALHDRVLRAAKVVVAE